MFPTASPLPLLNEKAIHFVHKRDGVFKNVYSHLERACPDFSSGGRGVFFSAIMDLYLSVTVNACSLQIKKIQLIQPIQPIQSIQPIQPILSQPSLLKGTRMFRNEGYIFFNCLSSPSPKEKAINEC
jgi:hypothetical protein